MVQNENKFNVLNFTTFYHNPQVSYLTTPLLSLSFSSPLRTTIWKKEQMLSTYILGMLILNLLLHKTKNIILVVTNTTQSFHG